MDPILVGINRKRCVLLGLGQAAIGLATLGVLAIPLWAGIFDWVILFGLLAAGFFLWFAAFFFGLAHRAPVALRMDAQGISGYYADAATWDEIKEIKVVTGHKRHKLLGFELHDPVAFRDRQTSWRRFQSWSTGRSGKVHLTVPELVLADADVEDLAQKAQQFHAAAQP